ncbi:enoyl-CoA hydratase/isomerase family protein [Micromonospora maris]|uniref:3-hydroxyisobutyryl-CoA hydrolase n=1 Tax=Micromonospora maris TaxID=1003110 RepID=A0A9X0HZ11_9ACTN|nr:enoyl-CoA hydratase/isomerase family protein [Micromonospora maris]AEB44249.1 3-hydroxyisobutyryl-CoA hydrolase [Micromonospora maris AB-18-032]KUJ43805.1 3-hydroxyisobutyryl-CoA hydrolase [Micromonospora maris]
MSAPPVIARLIGHLGHLTLNRPAAINALTAEMVTIIRRTLAMWAASDRVRTVLVSGAGGRGLCAGGDIRAIHADAVSGGTASLDFWADEYRLNATIAAYPKPIVAWMDGLVMGGGIGISGHASLRVVTERSRLAMPEVGIGFHPDVGGSWLLSRAPGQLGTHLALTGNAIGAADAIAVGLADYYVPSERLPYLRLALARRDAADAVTSFATTPPESDRTLAHGWIDDSYCDDTVAGIVERLAHHPDPDARAAAKTIATRSPTSLVVTLRSLRSAARLPDLPAALAQEYRLSAALLRLPDLAEGIRAQIIDKDRQPRWQPATLVDVPPELVDACFATIDNPPDLTVEGQ